MYQEVDLIIPSLDYLEGGSRLVLLGPVCCDPQPSWRLALNHSPPPWSQLVERGKPKLKQYQSKYSKLWFC